MDAAERILKRDTAAKGKPEAAPVSHAPASEAAVEDLQGTLSIPVTAQPQSAQQSAPGVKINPSQQTEAAAVAFRETAAYSPPAVEPKQESQPKTEAPSLSVASNQNQGKPANSSGGFKLMGECKIQHEGGINNLYLKDSGGQ